jgi:ankyrin repeat protein
VRILLEAGADVHDERMPLHVAAEYGYETIIAALIEFGADVNRLDQRGRTPLDLAGTPGATALLQKHGAQSADPGLRNL